MLDKYLKIKSFNAWFDHQRFMTKLTNTPEFYSIWLPDYRKYEVLFFDGSVFNYKFFNKIYYEKGGYLYFSFHAEKFIKKNKNKEEIDKIIEVLVNHNVLEQQVIPHLFYKNAKPDHSIVKGSEYDSFGLKLRELNFDNSVEILDFIDNE